MSEKYESTGDRKQAWISLDVIVPVYNEEAVLGMLFDRLRGVFSEDERKKHRIASVRYVFIDDGSTDRSAQMIRDFILAGGNAVLYRFSRNFGHQSAVSAGLEKADGDVVAVIDADLQDPPEYILPMIEKWRQGYDVVYGERKKRKENFIKVGAYWMFYRILSFLAEIDIPLDSGDFSIIGRRVVDAMRAFPEKLRFPRVLRAWVGFKQTGLTYERASRQAGSSKYSLPRLYKLGTDGITSASTRLLKVSQFFSVCYLALVTVLAFFCLQRYIAYRGGNELALYSLFGHMLIALGSFVQTLCIYILSSYVGRIYHEAKGRPSYVMMEVVGNERSDNSQERNEKLR